MPFFDRLYNGWKEEADFNCCVIANQDHSIDIKSDLTAAQIFNTLKKFIDPFDSVAGTVYL